MLVNDVQHEIDLHVFSQPVNVPASLIIKSKDATPAEYALRSSGYAKSIIEVGLISGTLIIYHRQFPFVIMFIGLLGISHFLVFRIPQYV